MTINKINAKKSFLTYLPFITFFAIIFYWHLTLQPSGDDLAFSKLYYQNNIFINILFRYEHWSSRFLIEFFLMPLASLPRMVWNVLDSIVFLLIAVLIPKIALNKEKLSEKSFIYYSLSCFLVLMYIFTNARILSSAGYIATTLNYIWPLFFGLVHFYLLKKYVFNENNLSKGQKIAIYSIMIFALIFAINQELMLLIVFGAYFFIILYCLYNKVKIPKPLYLMLFIIFLGFLNVYLCPGNHIRYYVAISRGFQDYYTLTLINKIDLGITVLLNRIMRAYSTISLFFFGVLGIYVYSITKKKIPTLISLTPFIIVLILKLMFITGYLPILAFIDDGVTRYGLLHSNLINILVISAIYAVIVFSVMYSLIKIYKHREKRMSSIIFCLLILGFASQMIRGFSPASVLEPRVDLYYLFCVVCATYLLGVGLLESRYDSCKKWLMSQKYGKFMYNLLSSKNKHDIKDD